MSYGGTGRTEAWGNAPASPSMGFGDTLPTQMRSSLSASQQLRAGLAPHGHLPPPSSGVGGAGAAMPATFAQNAFFFQQRRGKLDFKNLARVDLDRVVEEVDIDTLQDWIENVTFSELDREDMLHFTDDHFLKLFKLSQLTIEYLLNVQNALVSYANGLEGDCEAARQQVSAIDEKMHGRSEEITILRRELRQRRKTIATYEAMLASNTHHRQQAMNAAAAQLQAQGGGGGGGGGAGQQPVSAHVCEICSKAFVSADYLASHMARKHPEVKAADHAEEDEAMDEEAQRASWRRRRQMQREAEEEDERRWQQERRKRLEAMEEQWEAERSKREDAALGRAAGLADATLQARLEAEKAGRAQAEAEAAKMRAEAEAAKLEASRKAAEAAAAAAAAATAAAGVPATAQDKVEMELRNLREGLLSEFEKERIANAEKIEELKAELASGGRGLIKRSSAGLMEDDDDDDDLLMDRAAISALRRSKEDLEGRLSKLEEENEELRKSSSGNSNQGGGVDEQAVRAKAVALGMVVKHASKRATSMGFHGLKEKADEAAGSPDHAAAVRMTTQALDRIAERDWAAAGKAVAAGRKAAAKAGGGGGKAGTPAAARLGDMGPAKAWKETLASVADVAWLQLRAGPGTRDGILGDKHQKLQRQQQTLKAGAKLVKASTADFGAATRAALAGYIVAEERGDDDDDDDDDDESNADDAGVQDACLAVISGMSWAAVATAVAAAAKVKAADAAGAKKKKNNNKAGSGDADDDVEDDADVDEVKDGAASAAGSAAAAAAAGSGLLSRHDYGGLVDRSVEALRKAANQAAAATGRGPMGTAAEDKARKADKAALRSALADVDSLDLRRVAAAVAAAGLLGDAYAAAALGGQGDEASAMHERLAEAHDWAAIQAAVQAAQLLAGRRPDAAAAAAAVAAKHDWPETHEAIKAAKRFVAEASGGAYDDDDDDDDDNDVEEEEEEEDIDVDAEVARAVDEFAAYVPSYEWKHLPACRGQPGSRGAPAGLVVPDKVIALAEARGLEVDASLEGGCARIPPTWDFEVDVDLADGKKMKMTKKNMSKAGGGDQQQVVTVTVQVKGPDKTLRQVKRRALKQAGMVEDLAAADGEIALVYQLPGGPEVPLLDEDETVEEARLFEKAVMAGGSVFVKHMHALSDEELAALVAAYREARAAGDLDTPAAQRALKEVRSRLLGHDGRASLAGWQRPKDEPQAGVEPGIFGQVTCFLNDSN